MDSLRRRLHPVVLAAALAPLLAASAAGQTATLVRNITVGIPEDVEFGPVEPLAAVPGHVFFSVTGGSGEVWTSDGTADGTFQLVDACPGPCGVQPKALGSLRGVVFWAAQAADTTSSLWRSDGTRAGTFRLAEEPVRVNLDESPLNPAQISSVSGGAFHFITAGAMDALWRTDGTRAGTRMVHAFAEGQVAETLLADAGKVFLIVRSDEFGDTTWSVWASDGTLEGTREVADLGETRPLQARVAGGRLFFLVRDETAGDEIWASDGSVAGTGPVTDFAAPSPFDDPHFTAILRVSGGRLFFVADDVIHGQELYTSDGTPAGTRRITDFGFDEPGFTELVDLGGRVVFTANDGLGHQGVWTTDGDPAGTRFLPLPCGADCLFQLRAFVKVGRRAVLFAQFNVLSTDGTPAGTRLLHGCANSCTLPANLSAEMEAVPFATGFSIDSLWITDGTPAGTRRRTRVRAGLLSASSYSELPAGSFTAFFSDSGFLALGPGGGGLRRITAPGLAEPGTLLSNLAPLGDRLAFTVCQGIDFSLWQSAGTETTTAPAVVLTSSPDIGCVATVEPGDMASLGSVLLLLQRIPSGVEKRLWRSDGTPAGTRQLTPEGLAVQGRLAVGIGRVYFTATSGEIRSLWTSDGTPAGTRQLAAWPAAEGGPNSLGAVGSELYFFVGFDDSELWKSDGTPQGTGKVTDLDPPDGPAAFTRVGSTVYFVAGGAGFDDVVWRTDGTAGGTRELGTVAGMDSRPRPTELTAFGGSLYFFAWVEHDVRGLWRSDGTAAGTVLLARFPDSGNPSQPTGRQLTAAGGKLFLTADAGAGQGSELWTTDGTPAGTRPVRDISPGGGSSRPDHLTAAGGRLYFTAAESVHGRELWVSDGTAAGTRLVHDIAPFGASSEPASLTAAGGRLYFTADDGALGRELWSLPLAGPAGCQPSATRLCLNGGRYQVEARWRTGPRFHVQSGPGTAVPLSGDTGYFWFFDAANVEVVIKVLDGRPLNGHVWVFYGALSNVDYSLTVTDTQTGATRRYHNLPGRLASVGDTQGFGPLGAFSTAPATVEPPASPPLALELVAERVDPAAASPCQAGPRTLCLNGNRFAVTVAWKDFQNRTGPGTAVPLTADTGTFWFFDPANVELVVKVLDGRPLNGKFWLFYGALSNVEYTLTVTDSETGTIRTYQNPSGRFASVADTAAF